jgi:tetratricopeptide (TPR) repeat protein
LAMRNWLAEEGKLQEYATDVIDHLAQVYPSKPFYDNRSIWLKYIAHVSTAIELGYHWVELRDVASGTKSPGSAQQNLARLTRNVASCYLQLGKYSNSEKLYRQSSELLGKSFGPMHPETLSARGHLAQCVRKQGNNEEAEDMYRQAIATCRSTPDSEEYVVVMASLNNGLALVLMYQDKYEDAEAMFQAVLEKRMNKLGPRNVATLTTMGQLAKTLVRQERYDEVEKIYRQILEIQETKRSTDDRNIFLAKILVDLACVLCDQGQLEEAETRARRGVEVFKKILGVEDPETIIAMSKLAGVLNQREKLKNMSS